MKKILALFLVVSFVLSGCSAKGLTQVKPKAVIDKFEADESFVVYLGLSYCSTCKIFKSIIETVIEETGVVVLYVEYDKEDQAILETLVKEHLEQNDTFGYSFPVIYVVEDGQIIDEFSLQQTDTEIKFKERLIRNGVIE